MDRMLIYCLLCAFSTSLAQAGISKRAILVFNELIPNLNKLNETLKMDADWLHSPKNVLKNCLHSAFNCFKNATLFLKPAVGRKADFDFILSRIKSFQYPVNPADLSAPDSTCSPCRSYKKEAPHTFLMDFKSLLQRLNRLHMRK